jgi:hypothetical protein
MDATSRTGLSWLRVARWGWAQVLVVTLPVHEEVAQASHSLSHHTVWLRVGGTLVTLWVLYGL